jgi:hypothetical protein
MWLVVVKEYDSRSVKQGMRKAHDQKRGAILFPGYQFVHNLGDGLAYRLAPWGRLGELERVIENHFRLTYPLLLLMSPKGVSG